jgi:S1-C subfamily serine protease
MNIFIAKANNLSVSRGAYVVQTVPGGPAEQAGLQGGTNSVSVNGVSLPAGGDVIIAAEGTPIENYTDLLAYIAQKDPGAQGELTILRNGQQQTVTAILGPRPNS